MKASTVERRRKQQPINTTSSENNGPNSSSTSNTTSRPQPKNHPNKPNKVWMLIALVFGAFFFFRVSMRWGVKRLDKLLEKYVLDKNAPNPSRLIHTLPPNMRGQQQHQQQPPKRLLSTDSDSNGEEFSVIHREGSTRDHPVVCVTTTSITNNSTDLQCQVKMCRTEETSPSAHYGYGFVQRPDSLKQNPISMTLSGQKTAGSGCAMSHKYQFIYIHVLKSGGMTLKTFLKEGLCHNSTQMPCQAGPEYLEIVSCRKAVLEHPHYFVWSFVRNPYSRMYSSYAMAYDYRAKQSKQRPQKSPLLPPFSFADYVHANSTNNNFGKKNQHRRPSMTKKGRDISSLATAAWNLKRNLLETSHDGNSRRTHSGGKRATNPSEIDSLLAKMNSLLNEGSTGSSVHNSHNQQHRTSRHTTASINKCKYRRSMTYMDMVHCQPQHSFLFNNQECPVFDFLGRLEHFAADLKTVVDTIQSPELAEHYQRWLTKSTSKHATATTTAPNNMSSSSAQQVVLHKDTSTSFGSKQKQATYGGSLQLAYQTAPGLQQAVAQEYAKDFKLLGYDPNIVPA